MLVLSRGRNDKIVFPNLGITVEILNIASNKVRVGIDAPPSVTVLRHELAGEAGSAAQADSLNPHHKLSHEIRNRLHAANLALHLSQKLLQANRQADAERTLQKALDEFAAVEQRLTSRDQPAPADAPGRPRGHALIVEDNLNESELLASYLRLSGFQVDTARDGCDALSLLESELRPDAILLDMRMPRCDGPTTVNAIRSNPDFRDLKVYAISGTSPDLLGIERGPRGVDRWFPKPLNPEVLVRELSHQLNVTSA
jgi:carbon storage regulator CsrA